MRSLPRLGGSAITAEVGEDHVHSRPQTAVQGRNDRGAGPFDAPAYVLSRALGFECDHVSSEVGEGATSQSRPLVGQVKDAQILEEAEHDRQPRAPPISQIWNESHSRISGGRRRMTALGPLEAPVALHQPGAPSPLVDAFWLGNEGSNG